MYKPPQRFLDSTQGYLPFLWKSSLVVHASILVHLCSKIQCHICVCIHYANTSVHYSVNVSILMHISNFILKNLRRNREMINTYTMKRESETVINVHIDEKCEPTLWFICAFGSSFSCTGNKIFRTVPSSLLCKQFIKYSILLSISILYTYQYCKKSITEDHCAKRTSRIYNVITCIIKLYNNII